jgi:hypothetical protein
MIVLEEIAHSIEIDHHEGLTTIGHGEIVRSTGIDHHEGSTMIGHGEIAVSIVTIDPRKVDQSLMGMTGSNRPEQGEGIRRHFSASMRTRKIAREKTDRSI